jgi:hypothetical protein
LKQSTNNYAKISGDLSEVRIEVVCHGTHSEFSLLTSSVLEHQIERRIMKRLKNNQQKVTSQLKTHHQTYQDGDSLKKIPFTLEEGMEREFLPISKTSTSTECIT